MANSSTLRMSEKNISNNSHNSHSSHHSHNSHSSHHSATSDDPVVDFMGQDDYVGPVIVFQCLKCSAVISDSMSWIGSCEGTGTIVCQGVSSDVQVDEELHTSHQGPYLGCSYHSLLCRSCQSVLGMQYITTQRHLDNVRGLFMLLGAALCSYEVGSNITKSNTSLPESVLNVDIRKVAQDLQATKDIVKATKDTVKEMQKRIEKLEKQLGKQSSKNVIEEDHLKSEDSDSEFNEENISPVADTLIHSVPKSTHFRAPRIDRSFTRSKSNSKSMSQSDNNGGVSRPTKRKSLGEQSQHDQPKKKKVPTATLR